MKKLSLILLITFVLGLNLTLSASAEQINWYYSFSDAQKEAQKTGKPMLVDVYTDWCGYCKKLDKDVFTDTDVINLSKSFVCVKVDGDKYRSVVQKYGVRGYPTTLFLKPNGSVIKKAVGYMGADEYLKDMKNALK
ncbi:MAG: thioredoxin family protein [Armatimonadota bacterium]